MKKKNKLVFVLVGIHTHAGEYVRRLTYYIHPRTATWEPKLKKSYIPIAVGGRIVVVVVVVAGPSGHLRHSEECGGVRFCVASVAGDVCFIYTYTHSPAPCIYIYV